MISWTNTAIFSLPGGHHTPCSAKKYGVTLFWCLLIHISDCVIHIWISMAMTKMLQIYKCHTQIYSKYLKFLSISDRSLVFIKNPNLIITVFWYLMALICQKVLYWIQKLRRYFVPTFPWQIQAIDWWTSFSWHDFDNGWWDKMKHLQNLDFLCIFLLSGLATWIAVNQQT